MNKSQLIEAISSSADINKKQAEDALNALTSAVTSELANGNDVALVGFGTFSVNARAARTGRNPQTGEAIQISASNVPKFKPGKSLKEAVNV